MDNVKSTYGIIGNPVEHSLSPVMHNTAFRELDVDAEYKLFPLKEDEIEEFFEKLRDSNSPIFGLNVTVPYKQTVLRYVDTLSPFAEKVKAVNTIVIQENRQLIGHNTDGPGFLAHLTELQFNPENKRITLLGAGGTARAIISVLCMLPERPESIRIYNRSPERLAELLNDLGQRIDIGIVECSGSIDELNIELADLLINTTSLGMKADDECLVDESLVHSNLLVYDTVYSPAETKLLKLAKQCGARTSNGLGMLFYQGVLAFQHWADIQLEDDIKTKMRQSLEEKIRQ